MTILEQILAGLQQKFAGVDTAILTRIATKKAEGVTVHRHRSASHRNQGGLRERPDGKECADLRG